MAIWTPSQKGKAKKLKEEGCAQVYRVEVPAPRVQEAVQNAFVRLQLGAKIAGFRPGKAPLDVVKRQYAAQARSQAVDDLLRTVVPETIKDLELKPVAVPSVGAIDLPEDGALVFELHLEVAPTFDLKGYKGLAITKRSYPVTDKEIESRLVQLQEGNARLERSASETVGPSHYAVIDYELLRDGAPVKGGQGKQELVDMSSEQTVKGLGEGLAGAKRGETREFPVEIEGGKAVCKATVQEIKDKVLPKLDDDFAKDMGFDTLELLKSKMREIVQAEGERKTEKEVLDQIEKGLLEANRFPVPPTLAEHQLEHTIERIRRAIFGNRDLSDTELEKLKEKVKPEAEDQVRLSFILSAIAQREKIDVGEEDLKGELERNLEKAHSEEQKRDVRAFFEKSKDEVEAALRDRKVLDFIRGAAKIKEEAAA